MLRQANLLYEKHPLLQKGELELTVKETYQCGEGVSLQRGQLEANAIPGHCVLSQRTSSAWVLSFIMWEARTWPCCISAAGEQTTEVTFIMTSWQGCIPVMKGYIT